MQNSALKSLEDMFYTYWFLTNDAWNRLSPSAMDIPHTYRAILCKQEMRRQTWIADGRKRTKQF